MTILETPRVYFRGDVSWDPITTNNYANFYDERCATPTLDTVDPVADFRQSAVAAIVPQGNWNPQGTHRARFYDCAVSGVDVGGGLKTEDAFVAAPANFLGMLVDLEPYGAFSSQLFFDEMSFGVAGGCQIKGKRVWRFTDRQINFNRNLTGIIAGVASVVWQTSFPKDHGLEIHAHDSVALAAIEKALHEKDVRGLTVRFVAYHTVYYDDPTIVSTDPNWRQKLAARGNELAAKIAAGGFQPNPARSQLVGAIGLWRDGEPALEPGDRALLAQSQQRSAYVATARARVAANSVTVDLSNSISETDPQLTKQNWGTLQLVAVDAKGVATPLGDIPYAQYDRSAYLATSGLVTLPLNSAQAAAATGGDLQLRHGGSSGPDVLLKEQRYYITPETPNLYIDADAPAHAAFQIRDRGLPAAGARSVDVYQMDNGGGSVVGVKRYESDAHGRFSFPIVGKQGDIFAYVPTLKGDAPPTAGIDPQLYTYMYLRILPDDAGIAALDPTWTNVFERVLANWNAMAPCMDNWLDLSNPEQVLAYAKILKRLTDPANFESFRYMPVVRDLTKGARTLLWNFLDAPAAPAPVVAEKETAQTSRSMRAAKLD